MDITPFLESFRADLSAAAQAGEADTQAAAERLLRAVAPAARLMLLEACSQAAAEISAELTTGHVDVRLNGRDPEFVVTSPPAMTQGGEATPPEAIIEDESVCRITLRLPESLKTKAEERAAQAGISLNSWLVSAVRTATANSAVNIDIDLSSLPFFERPHAGSNKHMTGWV